MQNRGGYQPYRGGYGSPKGYGSSGDEGFRSPRPQYHSSPRGYHNPLGPRHQRTPRPQFNLTPTHGHGQYHPGISPIHQQADNPRGRYHQMPSPGMHSTPNFRGGRGGRGRFHSGSQSPNSESNPGGSDNIQAYVHRSMLQDPWAGLEPVPISTPMPSFTT